MRQSLIAALGERVIRVCTSAGQLAVFCIQTIYTLFTTRFSFKKLFSQMEAIGVGSLGIGVLTGAFGGAVLALQTYIGFKKFGGQEFMGRVVALSMTRELGPVLTGLMVTGRAGSAIAAEIAAMRISEQIEALTTLCINPFNYLVVPRVVAGTLILPFLSIFATIAGIGSGYCISVYALGLNGHQYLMDIQRAVELSDITNGLIKASVFGCILSVVGSFRGYYADGGARGVGRATTESVVVSSVLVLIANYFLTALLFY